MMTLQANILSELKTPAKTRHGTVKVKWGAVMVSHLKEVQTTKSGLFGAKERFVAHLTVQPPEGESFPSHVPVACGDTWEDIERRIKASCACFALMGDVIVSVDALKGVV